MGWKKGVFDIRLLAGQRAENGHQRKDLCIGEIHPQLGRTHDPNRLREIPNLPRVEVRSRQLDVPKGWRFENIFVFGGLSDCETTLVTLR